MNSGRHPAHQAPMSSSWLFPASSDATCAAKYSAGSAEYILSTHTLLVLLVGAILGVAAVIIFQRLRRNATETTEVVACFCNPKLPRSFGLKPLSFGQDLKFMMRTLQRGLLYVEPAASLYTMRRALVTHRPRFLCFSGHCHGGSHLCWETPDGKYDADATLAMFVSLLRSLAKESAASPPLHVWELEAAAAVEAHLEAQQSAALEMQHCSRSWMEAAAAERAARGSADANDVPSSSAASSSMPLPSFLRKAPSILRKASRERANSGPDPRLALSRLSCIVINACSSLQIAKALVRALPGVTVVCWSTIVEDSAARAFLVGFMNKVAEMRESTFVWSDEDAWFPHFAHVDGIDLVTSCFVAGCASFSRGGFRFGDPTDFLHPPGHPHWLKPDFRTCRHCAPPVQGQVVLLHSDGNGGVEEVHGRDLLKSDSKSWTREWRVLGIGIRMAQRRTSWTATSESVRDLHKAHLRESAESHGMLPASTVRSTSRSMDDLPQSTGGVYPEVGQSSQYAQPGAFRRAHVLGNAASSSTAPGVQGASNASSFSASSANGEKSPPGSLSVSPKIKAYAEKPLDLSATNNLGALS